VSLAYAVLHTDPPEVYAAEDLEVLHRVIALRVVARTPSRSLPPDVAEVLRSALLAERWADAVSEWITVSGIPLDVYPDGLDVWGPQNIDMETAGLQLQFAPLFRDERE
jgi:hypothetical protein